MTKPKQPDQLEAAITQLQLMTEKYQNASAALETLEVAMKNAGVALDEQLMKNRSLELRVQGWRDAFLNEGRRNSALEKRIKELEAVIRLWESTAELAKEAPG